MRRGRSGALYDRDGVRNKIHRRDAQAGYHMADGPASGMAYHYYTTSYVLVGALLESQELLEKFAMEILGACSSAKDKWLCLVSCHK